MKKYERRRKNWLLQDCKKKPYIINEMGKEVWKYVSTDEKFMSFNIWNMPSKLMLGSMMIWK